MSQSSERYRQPVNDPYLQGFKCCMDTTTDTSPMSNPYPHSSEEWSLWSEGFEEAQSTCETDA